MIVHVDSPNETVKHPPAVVIHSVRTEGAFFVIRYALPEVWGEPGTPANPLNISFQDNYYNDQTKLCFTVGIFEPEPVKPPNTFWQYLAFWR